MHICDKSPTFCIYRRLLVLVMVRMVTVTMMVVMMIAIIIHFFSLPFLSGRCHGHALPPDGHLGAYAPSCE